MNAIEQSIFLKEKLLTEHWQYDTIWTFVNYRYSVYQPVQQQKGIPLTFFNFFDKTLNSRSKSWLKAQKRHTQKKLRTNKENKTDNKKRFERIRQEFMFLMDLM